jgi:hypothetical protein
VVYVIPKDATPADNDELDQHTRLDEAHHASPNPFSIKLRRFSIGDQCLAVSHAHNADERELADRWRPYLENFDLAEPFGRIRDAIDEACRSAR